MHAATAEIGPLIADLRLKRGWDQSTLAAEANLTISTIGRIENGRSGAYKSTAMALFEAFRDNPPGLRRSEAERFLSLCGFDLRLADHPRIKDDGPHGYHAEARSAIGDRLEQLVSTLSRIVALSGSASAAADLLEFQMAAAEQWLNKYFPGHVNQPPGEEEVVATVEHPPIQRQGYTEQVRVDYVRKPDREPKAPESQRHAS